MAQRPAPTAELLTIGSVLALLQPEYPDVTISKIRFLESAGLIEPIRTPSGYRKFAPRHVERLRYVLRMQRDYFLPLRVIGEHLEAMDRGMQPPDPLDSRPRIPEAVENGPVGIDVDLRTDGTDVRISREELAAESGFSIRELIAIEDAGFIRPLAEGRHYGADAATVVSLLAQLGRLGLDIRHLGPTRRAATQQCERVEALLLSARRDRQTPAGDDLRARARELASLQLKLQSALLAGLLSQLLDGTRT